MDTSNIPETAQGRLEEPRQESSAGNQESESLRDAPLEKGSRKRGRRPKIVATIRDEGDGDKSTAPADAADREAGGAVETTAEAALEAADEMEETSAEIIDTELATLLRTPLGLRGAIEAVLFTAAEPISPRRLANLVGLSETRLVHATLEQLRNEYETERRGFQILETAGGYQLATRQMFADLILRLKNRRRRPALSGAALETLAIIAYRQPIIRAEIEAVRGVESSGTVRNLIDMGMVAMVGRKDVLGRPAMYGTTEQFLKSFGLRGLNDLPPIAELKRQLAEKQKETQATAEAEAEAAAEQVAATDLGGEAEADLTGASVESADAEATAHEQADNEESPDVTAVDDEEEAWDDEDGEWVDEEGDEDEGEGEGEEEKE